ncbi:hypothetical protein VPH35_049018 [Triticum aestivum]
MRALRLFVCRCIDHSIWFTDNSFKLWDLSMNQARVIDNPIQTSTGHINTKIIDRYFCVLSAQTLPKFGVLCDSGIAGGCRESSLIHVHCPLCIFVMLSYFSQQEDAFVYVHCL